MANVKTQETMKLRMEFSNSRNSLARRPADFFPGWNALAPNLSMVTGTLTGSKSTEPTERLRRQIMAASRIVLTDSNRPVLRSSHGPVVSDVMRLIRSDRDDQPAIYCIQSHSCQRNSVPADQF